MDKKKEGLITSLPEALTEAAKINVAATKDMASSAVTAFVLRRYRQRKASKRKETRLQGFQVEQNQAFRDRRQAQQKDCRQETCSVRVLQRSEGTATKARGSSKKTSQEVFHKIARLKRAARVV